MIKRNIFEKLQKFMKNKEILALIGSRQVGKTTLMNMLFNEIKEEKTMISFENQKILALFETNLDEFIEQYVKFNKYLFIDEIQYSNKSGQNLKYIYDSFDIKIVISGSSATDLSIKSLSYLVGRVLTFEIFPLTFEEFINYKSSNDLNFYNRGLKAETLDFMKNYFEEFLIYGGYPRVIISNTKEEKEEIIKNLVNSYILKEIREILSFENSYEYEKLLEIMAVKNGGILNKSNIASDSGINMQKIDLMLDILEKTYILKKVRPITIQKIKELIKSPKVYFQDLGFRNAILETFTSTDLRVDKGFIYENFILSELIKAGIKVKFYNYKNISEVDFIIEKGDKTIAIEIKSSINNNNIDKSYRNYIDKYSPDEFYIFNEKYFLDISYNNTKVVFTHFLNIFQLIKSLK